MNRRSFIRVSAIATALLGVATFPIKLLAAQAWNKVAFDSDDMDVAIKELYTTASHTPSDAVTLKTPEIAENGAAVPVTVKTSLDSVDSIALFSASNMRPLVTHFSFTSEVVPAVSSRIKLGKTGDVVAVVRSKGKLYSATNEVKVTIGGCGG